MSAFGEIDPNQDWDFTSGPRYGTRATSFADAISKEALESRAWSDYVIVDKTMASKVGSILKEGGKNKTEGENFLCTVPNNGFKITPIYQGANMCIDVTFHMVLVDKNNSNNKIDYLIWSKGEHMQKQITQSSSWTDVGDGTAGTTTYGQPGGSSNTSVYAIKSQSLEIKAEDLPVGYSIYFYTTATYTEENCPVCNGTGGTKCKACNGNGYTTSGYGYNKTYKGCTQCGGSGEGNNEKAIVKGLGYTSVCSACNGEKHNHYIHSSLANSADEQAEILRITESKLGGRPTGMGIPSDHEIMIISCEAGADEDLNDVLFLVEGGPLIPKPLDIKNGKYTTDPLYTTKRYMVEDLGASDKSDIDFNDIVVDLVQEVTEDHETKTANGQIVEDKIVKTNTTQTAQVYALGGTKDIEVYIGQTMIFKKSTATNINTSYPGNLVKLNPEKMYNTGTGLLDKTENSDTNYETSTAITTVQTLSDNPWVPNENNIWVKVYADSENSSSVSGNQEPSNKSWKITWPETGTVPQIIAVDQNVTWNQERVSVFTEEGEPGYNFNILKLVKK